MQKTQKKPKSAPIMVQTLIYAIVLLISEIISNFIPKSFPLPTPMVGLILLYLLLTFHIIKVQWVDSLSAALISIIGFLFVPPGVAVAANLKIIETEGVQLILVIVLSTVILLVVTTYTTRCFNWLKNMFRPSNTNNQRK